MEPLPTSGPLAFLLELDRLKETWRKNPVHPLDRPENSAEHSWHGAVAALALAPLLPPGVDAARVALLMVVHDLGEIDTGDVLAYVKNEVTAARDERAGLVRVLSLLPSSSRGASPLALWDEFEADRTPEARCAQALDRLLPCLENLASGGRAWFALGVRREQALKRNGRIGETFPALWAELEPRVRALFDAHEARPREVAPDPDV